MLDVPHCKYAAGKIRQRLVVVLSFQVGAEFILWWLIKTGRFEVQGDVLEKLFHKIGRLPDLISRSGIERVSERKRSHGEPSVPFRSNGTSIFWMNRESTREARGG